MNVACLTLQDTLKSFCDNFVHMCEKVTGPSTKFTTNISLFSYISVHLGPATLSKMCISMKKVISCLSFLPLSVCLLDALIVSLTVTTLVYGMTACYFCCTLLYYYMLYCILSYITRHCVITCKWLRLSFTWWNITSLSLLSPSVITYYDTSLWYILLSKYIIYLKVIIYFRNYFLKYIFTMLHGIQTRSCDDISVHLSVCLSNVCICSP